MKSELDLVREFAELQAAKVESWGTLPVASERRFGELKAYFDDLMLKRSCERIPPTDRFESHEIRRAVQHRSRLRIPAQMTIFFCHGDAYAPAMAKNLSRGGLFLGSEMKVLEGDRLTLYMPNLGRGYENLFETTVEVVWTAREPVIPGRGMGVRFRELPSDARDQLDDFVVAFLRDRISKSANLAHRPAWLTERRLIV